MTEKLTYEELEQMVMDQILVIDDDDFILTLIDKFLTHSGYRVKVAHDGVEGIELLKGDNNFKVVITDIRMPGKDGNQVAKYIRDADKMQDTPILAITGFPEDVDRRLFDLIVIKPFKMEILTNLIKTL